MEYVFQHLGYSKVKLCQFRSTKTLQLLHICKYCKIQSRVSDAANINNGKAYLKLLPSSRQRHGKDLRKPNELKSLDIALSQSLEDNACLSDSVKLCNVKKSSALGTSLQKHKKMMEEVSRKINNNHIFNDSGKKSIGPIHTQSINNMLNLQPVLKNDKSHNSCQSYCTEIGDRFFNEVDIEMLPRSIYKQLFGNEECIRPSLEKVEAVREELMKHNLLKSVEESNVEDLKLLLPPLEGNDVEQHFYIIGELQAGPYRHLLEELVKISLLPPAPDSWSMEEGWTCYKPDGTHCPVRCPSDDALVFDVEVCQAEGQLPTLAVALGAQSGTWYGWVSKSLANYNQHLATHRITPSDMIPLETKSHNPRIIVGHHVAYDRARCREQYLLQSSKIRFLDTMSLHISVSGVTSMQRAQLRAGGGKEEDWKNVTSLNSLLEVHKLYCPEEPRVEKESREIFMTGSLNEASQVLSHQIVTLN